MGLLCGKIGQINSGSKEWGRYNRGRIVLRSFWFSYRENFMIVRNENRLIERRDIIHLVVLVVIALVIGVYLIATTVLISKDGVFYIERAQQLASDPIKIIKAHPPGYPFLIMAAHKAISFFTHEHSNQAWIYSAQSVTLLCRLLALIPLYFIGKLLVGGKNSFWAMLILIFLPYPTRIVCDVVREWPYLLFLTTGFFFLLWSAATGKGWLFSLAGLSCGLGYLIRPESAQLIIYGLLWGVVSLFRPKLWGVSRWKNFIALVLLLIGFAIPAAPYMKCTARYFPPKAGFFIKSFFTTNSSNNIDTTKISLAASILNCNTAGIASQNVLKALGEIHKTVGENLMWFFMPPLLIGLGYRFRNKVDNEERFLITSFVLLNITVMVFQYCFGNPHASQRWSLPLVAFTVFYIPVGLRVVGNWLDSKRSGTKQKTDVCKKPQLSWFIILLLIGVAICLPKLFRPIRIEKQGYRKAANWLRENTVSTDIIAVSDNRIAFYAQREMCEVQRSQSAISAGQITSGNWYHLAGTFDGESQKLYINGELVAAKKLTFKTLGENNNDLVIGKHTSVSTSYFKGVIDDAILYSRALSAEEVKSLYNNDLSGIESSGLVGHCHLEGDSTGMDEKLNSALSFNGTSDYVDLTVWSSKLNSDAITVSIWVKTDLPSQNRWVIGSRTQFRIGIISSKAYFCIMEKSPGHEIPPKAAYVVEIFNNNQAEWNPGFSKKVEEKYSILVNKKKKKLVIYKVL